MKTVIAWKRFDPAKMPKKDFKTLVLITPCAEDSQIYKFGYDKWDTGWGFHKYESWRVAFYCPVNELNLPECANED